MANVLNTSFGKFLTKDPNKRASTSLYKKKIRFLQKSTVHLEIEVLTCDIVFAIGALEPLGLGGRTYCEHPQY